MVSWTKFLIFTCFYANIQINFTSITKPRGTSIQLKADLIWSYSVSLTGEIKNISSQKPGPSRYHHYSSQFLNKKRIQWSWGGRGCIWHQGTYNWFIEELVFEGRDKRKTVGGPKEDPIPKCEQRWRLPGNMVGEASFACAEGAHYVDLFANERTGCKGRQTNETPTQHWGRWD